MEYTWPAHPTARPVHVDSTRQIISTVFGAKRAFSSVPTD